MPNVDVGSFLLGVLVVLVVFVVIDVLVAGGGMSMGMMSGVAGMMATPWGWLLLLMIVVVALLAASLAGR